MRKIILIVFLFVFSNFAFSSEKPAWITTKKHPKYPERLYILGVGAAKKTKNKLEDIQKANNDAFADIVKQIRVTVASKSVVEQMEVIAGRKVESVERASAELQVTTELKIGGLKIVETYFDDDDDIYYSLAVLDRETAGKELKDMLNQFHSAYSKNFELARSNIIRGNIYQALLNIAESYKNIPPYNDILPLYRFITRPLAEADPGNEWKVADALLTSEIKSTVQDLFSKLKIEKFSGEEQEVVFNQVLKPLLIKVVYIDNGKIYPVSGIKFKFALQTGIGKISDRGVSDNSGTVKCDIFELKPHRENYYVVSAKLDLSEF
ncbi:MAG: LPP20 family lipoprotein [Candidatus Kryptonium sp.]